MLLNKNSRWHRLCIFFNSLYATIKGSKNHPLKSIWGRLVSRWCAAYNPDWFRDIVVCFRQRSSGRSRQLTMESKNLRMRGSWLRMRTMKETLDLTRGTVSRRYLVVAVAILLLASSNSISFRSHFSRWSWFVVPTWWRWPRTRRAVDCEPFIYQLISRKLAFGAFTGRVCMIKDNARNDCLNPKCAPFYCVFKSKTLWNTGYAL